MQTPDLLDTALHEIGHILGFGPIWDDLGFYQNLPDGDEHFNGPLAIAAFDEAGGRNYPGAKVPLADSGHWSYSVLAGELMAPSAIGGALSAITVQSLADLGYGVDVSQADPYTLPGAAGKAVAKVAAAQPAGPSFGENFLHPDVHGLRGAGQYEHGRYQRARLPMFENDNRTGRLEMAERVWRQGIAFLDGDTTGHPGLSTGAESEWTCGAGHMKEPIYVIDARGRIVHTIDR